MVYNCGMESKRRLLTGARLLTVAGLLCAQHLAAQSAAGDGPRAPAFEVASVRPNNSGDGRVAIMAQPGGRISMTNVTLRLMIRNAYRVQETQIVGGPDWLNTARFDVVAKADGNPPADEMPQMVRALLAERFKLTTHNEIREMPIYALVPARADARPGPQLKTSEADCAAGRGNAPPAAAAAPLALGQVPPCGLIVGFGSLRGRGIRMAALASSLSGFVGRVAVDRTNLTSGFDVDLSWTPDQIPQGQTGAGAQPLVVNGATVDPNGPSLFTALQEQLGLKLESTKGPVEVLVVDRAEKPSED
jgi:uncharacterized protein (TIGR03435 family)